MMEGHRASLQMLSILSILALRIQGSQTTNPIRSLSTGHLLEGSQVSTPSGNAANVFLGVPFAEPPIGQLRFQKTKPLMQLSEISSIPISCQSYKPSCLQNHTVQADTRISNMSEDCLYLNVLSGLECGRTNGNLCPVLYYIHGGAFEFDSPTMFSVDVLVDNFVSKGIVMVTVPYRLGAFGFWSTGSPEAPGNNGLYDVLEGLNWVQREIRTFGGDPNRVTIMGQSAGAAIVSLLTLTPKSEGLFTRAILMSRGPMIYNDLGPYEQLTKELGCARDKPHEAIDCMRAIDAKLLVDTFWSIEGVYGTHVSAPRIDGPDGLFPAPLPTLIKNRRRIDTIVGTTADENSFDKLKHRNATARTISELCQSRIRALNVKHEDYLTAECDRRYIVSPLKNSQDGDRIANVSLWAEQFANFKNDIVYFSPSFDEATTMSQVGCRVFLYSFDYVKRGLEGIAPWHAFDLTYILGIHPFQFDERDRQIQVAYATFFANFVKYGHPTPSDRIWKPLEEPPLDMHYLSIDLPSSSMKPRYHYEAVLFWNYIVPTVGEREEGERGHELIRSYHIPNAENQSMTDSLDHRDHIIVTALSVTAALAITVSSVLALYLLWRCEKKPDSRTSQWQWSLRRNDEGDRLLDRVENDYQTF